MRNKILASLLAVCLFVGLAVPAFASSTHNEENRVTKIAFDKPEYNFSDITTPLDSLMTAYDKNGNRLMFDDTTNGQTQLGEVTYKSENESILKVGQDAAGDDVLVLVRNTDKDEVVRITARAVTGETTEVKIRVAKGTQKTLDYGATGYTVKDQTIYYLNDGNIGDYSTGVTTDKVATITFTTVAGNLIKGKNVIKVGTKTTTIDLTTAPANQAALNKVLADNPIKVVTGSGKAITFNFVAPGTTDLPAGASASNIAWNAKVEEIAGTLVYAADTKGSVTGHELGTITGLTTNKTTTAVTATLNKGVIATAVTPVYANGETGTEGYIALPIEAVGSDFTDAQLNSFKYKISTGTTDGFKDVVNTEFNPTTPVTMANLEVAKIDGKLCFVIDEKALAAAADKSGGVESLINKKIYVHVYNELFASAQSYKTATIAIKGETAPDFAAYPAVINIGVGQNFDLRTIPALKDKKNGYAIDAYVSQSIIEAHRIAKVLADTNYIVRGIAQGTTTLKIGDVPVKLVVGPAQDYENDGYKDPSINPIVSLTVGAKYTIVVKNPGTIAPVFSSYDNKIATVDAKGVVTAIAPGVIKIKVVTNPNTDARKDLYATVTVKAAPTVVDPSKPTTPPSTGVSFFSL